MSVIGKFRDFRTNRRRRDAGKRAGVCAPSKDRNAYYKNDRGNDQTFRTVKNLTFQGSEIQFRRRVHSISNVS